MESFRLEEIGVCQYASGVERAMDSSFCLLSDCATEAAGLGMGLHYRDQL